MTPKRWIDPAKDRPEDGDFRIVKLADGRLRAAKWRQYSGSLHGCYADKLGDGIGSESNPIVAVGAPEKRKSDGGKNLVPQRAVRVPDELWSPFAALAAQRGSNCNTEINRMIGDYLAAPEPDDQDELLQRTRDHELETNARR